MATPDFTYIWSGVDAPTLCGPGACLCFSAASGWVHRLRLFADAGATTGGRIDFRRELAWVSAAPEIHIEPADPSRVLNPVYQEFSRHEPPTDKVPGLCLLLTGSAFEHHFSGVFCLHRDPTMPSRIVFDVDVADRCRAPIELLAATYQFTHRGGHPWLIDASPCARRAGSTAIAWTGGPLGDGMLELLADRPEALVSREVHGLFTSVQIQSQIDPDTFTHRLRYRWRWTSPSDLTR
jgi:hypothetical protein